MADDLDGPPQQGAFDLWNLFRLAGESESAFASEADVLRRQLAAGDWEGASTRGRGRVRAAFAARDCPEALAALDAATPRRAAPDPQIAFLFPGLGAEATASALELIDLPGPFAAILEEADRIAEPLLGVTISATLRAKGALAARPSRHRVIAAPPPPTAPAHAALLTLEYALAQTWLSWGVEPAYVAGYSLGEYAAACTAGLFPFADGLRLLIQRAQILESFPKSGLIAVNLDANGLARHLDQDLHVVAANGPEQTIIGGRAAALDGLARRLSALEIPSRVLPVEFAFHTPLLVDAQRALTEAAAAITTGPLKYPMVSTLTGRLLTEAEIRDPAYWARHLCEPVKFAEALETLASLGAKVGLELGPGPSLSRLIQTLYREPPIRPLASMPSEYDPRSRKAHMLGLAGQLWAEGAPVVGPRTLAIAPLARDWAPPRVSDPLSGLAAPLQQIFAQVLGHPQVGPDDNLFELGGNSLNSVRIALRIRSDFQVDLSVRDLLAAATPRALALVIEAAQEAPTELGELQMLPNGLMIRCPHPADAMQAYGRIFNNRVALRHGVSLGPESIVFDVGAEVGVFSLFVALEQPTAQLLCFEADSSLCEILEFNLFDVTDTAQAFNLALSGPGRAVSPPPLRGPSETPSSKPPRRTLSDLLHEQQVGAIDLLRLGRGASAAEVLGGLAPDHWPCVRQIIAEIHHGDAALLTEQLRDHGFQVDLEPAADQDAALVSLYATRPTQDADEMSSGNPSRRT